MAYELYYAIAVALLVFCVTFWLSRGFDAIAAVYLYNVVRCLRL